MKHIILIIILSIGTGAIFGAIYSTQSVGSGGAIFDVSSDHGKFLVSTGQLVNNHFNSILAFKVFGIVLVLGGLFLLIMDVIGSKKKF